MKLVYGYLRQQPSTVAAALAFAAANQILVLVDPVILRWVVDVVTAESAQKNENFYARVGALLAGGVVASFFAWVAKNYQMDYTYRVARRVSLQIYGDGVKNSLRLPLATLGERRSGEIAAKLQTARHEVDRYISAFIQSAFMPIVAVLFLILYAAQVHWALVAMYVFAVPAVVWISYILGREVREIQEQLLAASARFSGSAVEVLRNVELVKSMGLERRESEKVDTTSAEVLALERRKSRAARRLSFFHGAGVNGLRLGILVLMLYLVSSQQMTMGAFFSFLLYLYMLLNPIQEMGTVLLLRRETEAALAAVAPLFAGEVRQEEGTRGGTLEELAFEWVTFRYGGAAQTAVDGLSFTAARGEFIAFAGPSGAGKSTLLKLLLGLYTPEGGRILFNGKEAGTSEFEALRERIGLVSQDVQLFSGTIRDNLLIAKPAASDEECLEVLEQAAAGGLLARAAGGLDATIGESGLQLSGGEKQRLAIARALLRQPEFLIFDEATSALDSLTEREVAQTLRGLHARRNAITIAIAHRLSTIWEADRIYVLDQGRVVAAGTHAELLEAEGLYRELWMQQTKPQASKRCEER